ncbi:MAG: arginine repressor [Defluviitaleaceae bacterium]|nr:arginine repressor [Defluviitaleaceae bacterium]
MKKNRQEAILKLVTSRDIYTQGELAHALAQEGYTTTQATISRDIRELKLTKEPTDAGLKYSTKSKDEAHPLERIFREVLVSIDHAGHMLVLRTLSGMAMAVALAVDEMNFSEILGTIAGDDAVFCVVKSEKEASMLVKKLTENPYDN